jgi:transcriptional regulator with XRE-family HTH domain
MVYFFLAISVHIWYLIAMKDINEMIAKYIKTNRIRLKKTQKDLAEESGVSLMTLRRAEGGEIVSLETIVALMEVFGELEGLKSLFVVSELTPRAIVDQQEENRERVRKSKKKEDKGWVWGDSAE